MRNTFILSLMLFLTITAHGQENWLSASGGYAFTGVKDTDVNATGWRVDLSYEKNAYEGKMVNGVVVGYVSTAASVGTGLAQTDYKLNNWPIYYVPKYLIGGGSFKAFIKGAIGLHISDYTKTATLIIVEDNGVGFYGGLGAGVMQSIGTLYINAEYEWAFASNSYYKNGFINSATLGIGIKF